MSVILSFSNFIITQLIYKYTIYRAKTLTMNKILMHFSARVNGQKPIICRNTNEIINFFSSLDKNSRPDVIIIYAHPYPECYEGKPHCSNICDAVIFDNITKQYNVDFKSMILECITWIYPFLTDRTYEMLVELDNY